MKRLIGLMVVSALAGVGCGDDDDTIVDGGGDSGPVIELDGGEDAGGRDSGPVVPTQITGIPCDMVRGCPTPGGAEDCLAELSLPNVAAGLAMGIVMSDTVSGLPSGGTGVPGVLWPGGYCQADCRVDADCGPNAGCFFATEEEPGRCFTTCTFNREDNSDCRDGYMCLRLEAGSTNGVCWTPLSSIGERVGTSCNGDGTDPDTICKVERRDTNGIPGIQTPGDCASTETPLACVPRFERECRSGTEEGLAAGATCVTSDQCAGGLGCVEGTCTACPTGYSCGLVGCAPSCSTRPAAEGGATAGQSCETIADCARGLGCLDGMCTACPMGHACSSAGLCTFQNAAANFDRTTYNADSPKTCNRATNYCEHPGNPAASVGDNCDEDWDCPTRGGLCLVFNVSDEERSYCTSLDCDLGGAFGCGTDAVCNQRALGAPACLEGCVVGRAAGATADVATWNRGEDACPEGFGCYWNGTGAAGVANNGACVPGNFNDRTTPNIGASCTTDDDCWSPFGRGDCIRFNNGAQMCTVRDCGAPLEFLGATPGADAGCGQADAVCVGGVSADDPTFGVCFQTCESGNDCADGLDCSPILSMGKVCFVGCAEDVDCKTGQTCVGATATELGRCTAS
ncbi:MAG: hypothetical protein KF901_27180 [Myxococcales bacterium]|nr:hypothetical protein [Myxococcales bacterium]